MKRILVIGMLFCISIGTQGQNQYVATAQNPFGSPNKDAPPEILDYELLIGTCQCKSVSRIDQNTWADTVQMKWTFKYILNGMAVQDESFKYDNTYSGSIRQFNSDSSTWYVHYYTSTTVNPTLSSWSGNKQPNGDMILYREQKSPNGWDGFYKISFTDISEKGFNWTGAWVNVDESIIYPTWKIFCLKGD